MITLKQARRLGRHDGLESARDARDATPSDPYGWDEALINALGIAGTALAQIKRVGMIAFVLHQTHWASLLFGSDSGHLDPLPRMIEGAVIDQDHIFETFDQASMPFAGTHNPDSRIHLQAKAPRPITILAAIPSVQTNEK